MSCDTHHRTYPRYSPTECCSQVSKDLKNVFELSHGEAWSYGRTDAGNDNTHSASGPRSKKTTIFPRAWRSAQPLKTESCHNANFFVTGCGTAICWKYGSGYGSAVVLLSGFAINWQQIQVTTYVNRPIWQPAVLPDGKVGIMTTIIFPCSTRCRGRMLKLVSGMPFWNSNHI